jgi:uncharacterized protein
MNVQLLDEAVGLARRLKCVFVTTADRTGRPHLAVAADLAGGPAASVTVSAWFCPGTVANVQENPAVSLVVWDAAADRGFQLLGRVRDVRETAVLDGYDPGHVSESMPQTQRSLRVEVSEVLRFTGAPHSDLAE